MLSICVNGLGNSYLQINQVTHLVLLKLLPLSKKEKSSIFLGGRMEYLLTFL
jgi:hypothetical protein